MEKPDRAGEVYIDPWEQMDAPELRAFLRNAARLWLAHDGLWFQAVERRHGLQEAIDADRDAWERFSPLEARRIMKQLGMEPGGGLEALDIVVECKLLRDPPDRKREDIIQRFEG